MSDAAPRSLVPDLYALASQYRDAWLVRGEGCTSTFADHLAGTCTCCAEHLSTHGAADTNDADCAVPTCSCHHIAGPCACLDNNRARPVDAGRYVRGGRLDWFVGTGVPGLFGHLLGKLVGQRRHVGRDRNSADHGRTPHPTDTSGPGPVRELVTA